LPILFGPLDDSDDRAAFSCGSPDLDDWFHRRAGQETRRDFVRVNVARDPTLGIVGFYSLSTFTLVVEDLPAEIKKKLPRYNEAPAVLIGRLARDLRVKGQGVGELLIADAMQKVMDLSRKVAVYAIVVDAKDDKARAFYQDFGFQPLPSRPFRLFIPMATVHTAGIAAAK
jgi:GNAT superfamily N-acetyltransferase